MYRVLRQNDSIQLNRVPVLNKFDNCVYDEVIEHFTVAMGRLE